jgi:hypothetical protein
MDDGYATGDGEFLDRRKLPLLIEAAVKLWLGSTVVLPSHDSELDPGCHTTCGPLRNLVDEHNIVVVVVVVVVVVFIHDVDVVV